MLIRFKIESFIKNVYYNFKWRLNIKRKLQKTSAFFSGLDHRLKLNIIHSNLSFKLNKIKLFFSLSNKIIRLNDLYIKTRKWVKNKNKKIGIAWSGYV